MVSEKGLMCFVRFWWILKESVGFGSVTIDTFGKECLEEDKHLYMYKGKVGVPPLAMVDDVVCPAVCWIDTVEMTGFLNAKSNCKKIQFDIKDNWGIKKADEAKTGVDNLKDVQLEDYKIERPNMGEGCI